MAASSSSSPVSLQCPVYASPYDKGGQCPWLLSCGHTFCTCCLSKLATHNGIECPTNHKRMEAAKVEAVMKNAAVLDALSSHLATQQSNDEPPMCGVSEDSDCHTASQYCVDCEVYICDPVARTHLKFKVTSSHWIVGVDSIEKNSGSVSSLLCGEHGQAFAFFDVDCQCPVCRDCIVLTHPGHKFQSLGDTGRECCETMDALIVKANGINRKLRAAEVKVRGVKSELGLHFNSEAEKIKQTFEQVGRKRISVLFFGLFLIF